MELVCPVEDANIKQECDVETAKPSHSPSTEETAEFKDKSCISKEEPCCDSYDSEDPHADNAADAEEDCRGTKKSQVKLKHVENEAPVPYPDPRMPFPCLSTVSSKDQSTYLHLLMNKNTRKAPEKLKERVHYEVMEFMRYLQDVARMCANDYNFVSPGAMQYSEDLFMSCLECIKTLPQFYQIHEMTSLTGGTFNPGLNLTFEKQLLIMGDVDITDHQIVPADAQLASDYQSVSSENPPAKKAKDMHATISSDGNAEKLCTRYEPDVCLTHDALVKLLDNHGPDFGEQWELPVCIKINPEKGSGQKKTVYIDSPLLKTEMTVRERSHFYHEESLKLSIRKDRSKNVFHLMTELPASEKRLNVEGSQRNPICFENDGLNFDMDFTDLETFGETTTVKTPKVRKICKEEDACVKSKDATHTPTLNKSDKAIEHVANTSSSSLEEMNSSATVDGSMTVRTGRPAESEPSVPKTELVQRDPAQKTDQDLSIDSEDEKLVIDVSMSPFPTPTKQLDPTLTPASKTDPVSSESSPSRSLPRRTRQSRRSQTVTSWERSCACRKQCSALPMTGASPPPHPRRPTHPPEPQDPQCRFTPIQRLWLNPVCLRTWKKPEPGRRVLHNSPNICTGRQQHLDRAEKFYVPVHVLPKLEYQLCYGVESLTSSEACKLWTETLLHSSTVSYIAHINAFTSKVALVRKLPDDWKQNISCGFKPSKSLNILHHLLKKLTGLDKGQYLIVHKAGDPFVTLLKAATGKVSRGAYDLQQHHGSIPQPPASGLVPWIPVDPAVVLPFHKAHGRVPCTFPIFPPKIARAGPSNNMNTGGKTKKKRSKRAAKRKKYIEKLIQNTGNMAMVSEFLGQLSLNIGANEPRFPTVVPAMDFDPDRDAARIETAIKSKGVDEQTIIDVLTKRTYSQRRDIAFAYERRAKKDMISALKGALSGSLETVILGLMKSTAQYDASEIRGSIKGLGTDEETLIEILCSRSNDELVEIKKVYKELFKKDLDKDVAGDTSGNFAKLLLALVQTKRADPSSIVDYEKIDQDARALYDAGVGIKGTDVATWISIMSERSVPHLQKVFQRYKSYSPYDMQESIQKEVKGDLQRSFLVLVQCFENKQLYFANRLHEAMKSKGAKEKIVTRIIVSRCEVDLKKVCSEYKTNFGQSLQKTILEHTKGDYQKVLLGLCGAE
ncbi:hypothetical protein INR49_010793 [Caranx melampygus]|nr:hypothetical protein INR49_010793 [Caranx melampygus]